MVRRWTAIGGVAIGLALLAGSAYVRFDNLAGRVLGSIAGTTTGPRDATIRNICAFMRLGGRNAMIVERFDPRYLRFGHIHTPSEAGVWR